MSNNNDASSMYNSPSDCGSGGHSSSTGTEPYSPSSTTGSDTNGFMDRYLSGSSSTYDHKAAASTAISSFDAVFSGTSDKK